MLRIFRLVNRFPILLSHRLSFLTTPNGGFRYRFYCRSSSKKDFENQASTLSSPTSCLTADLPSGTTTSPSEGYHQPVPTGVSSEPVLSEDSLEEEDSDSDISSEDEENSDCENEDPSLDPSQATDANPATGLHKDASSRQKPGKKSYVDILLRDEDLEEKFIRGWGKGGQKVNKTNNCVQLKHLPTNIVIKCHLTRSLHINRKEARKLLKQKLDIYYNGDQSKVRIKEQNISQKIKKRKAEKARRHKKKKEALDKNRSQQDSTPPTDENQDDISYILEQLNALGEKKKRS